MFNPNQKEKYLEYCGGDEKVSALFKYTERYEEQLNKDICKMQTDELLNILSGMAKSTAVSERSRMTKYIEWCRANGFCKVNWLDKKLCPREKFLAVLDAAEDKYYISPEKYQEYVNILKAKSNDVDYDLPIFMAIYEGVTDYIDLAYLTIDDIDFKKSALNLHTSGEIKVSDELLKYLIVASHTDYLNNKSQKSSLNYSFQKNSIWKNSKDIDERGQVQKYRRRMMKIKEVLEDGKISISNLSNSGIFNYIIARTKEDGINILEDISGSELNRNQLNLKYQKYFMEKKLALNFWEFKYRFQEYFRHIE
ncbi:MAG: hypothetical protein HDT39_14580 [Lachnospiraceae bacterium]|nr:hypothetical protein [Lachnospiraceae bacterium]